MQTQTDTHTAGYNFSCIKQMHTPVNLMCPSESNRMLHKEINGSYKSLKIPQQMTTQLAIKFYMHMKHDSPHLVNKPSQTITKSVYCRTHNGLLE